MSDSGQVRGFMDTWFHRDFSGSVEIGSLVCYNRSDTQAVGGDPCSCPFLICRGGGG